MTQFSKLKTLLGELEAKLEDVETAPGTHEAQTLARQVVEAPGKRPGPTICWAARLCARYLGPWG